MKQEASLFFISGSRCIISVAAEKRKATQSNTDLLKESISEGVWFPGLLFSVVKWTARPEGVTDILFSAISSFLGQRPQKLWHQRDILWAVNGSLTCGVVAFAKGLILGPPHCQRNNCCFYIPVKSQLSLVWKLKNAQPNFTHGFEFFEGFQDMAISVNCNIGFLWPVAAVNQSTKVSPFSSETHSWIIPEEDNFLQIRVCGNCLFHNNWWFPNWP